MTKNFEFSKITYLKPKKTANMYVSKLYYEDKVIDWQLKRKITLSGVYREGNKYYIDLLFDNDNEKDMKFIKMYKQLEMRSIDEIYNKYNEWMGVEDKLEREEVYSSFKSHLTEEDGIYRIRFNLQIKKNMMETKFYNEELTDEISFREVEEGDEISLQILLYRKLYLLKVK